MKVLGEPDTDRYGTLWSRPELIVAFDLYCRIPFKKTKANNPEVIKIAKLLGRSPASIARKLGNFGSLDPELQRQNVSGLLHTSKLDREIWKEFHNNWNQLVIEASLLKESMGIDFDPQKVKEIDIQRPSGPSEKVTNQKTRIHQTFFRQAILSSYENTCCITGLRIEECLVASHIIPWSVSEEHRTDPRNGLCLSATFDRLFDRGLITVRCNCKVEVSPALLESKDTKINEMVCYYHNKPIVKPKKFPPSKSNLEWHSINIFMK